MGVTANDRRLQVPASATQTVFDLDFPVAAMDDLEVWRARSGAVTLLATPADYAVSNLGLASLARVTLASGALAGDTYTFVGRRGETRATDFVTSGDFRADDIDAELDRIYLGLQELRRDADRSLRKGAASDVLEAGGAAISNVGWEDFADKAAAIPAAPSSGYGRLYARLVSGTMRLFWKQPSGTEADLTAAGDQAAAAAASAAAASASAGTAAGAATTAAGAATTANAAAAAAQGYAAGLNLPSLLGGALKLLRVKSDESGYELATISTSGLQPSNNLSDVSSKKASYDNLRTRGADVASASTIDLDAATGDLVDVTGTTAITAITLSDGRERTVRFTGALTLTHGASLVLPGAASITTAVGDVAVFRGYASGVVRCVGYTKANGQPVVGSAGGGGNAAYIHNLTLVASVASNALTIAVKTAAGADPAGDISVAFRSDTEASGSYDTLSLSGALSLTLSSGSTMGFANGTPGRLWVVLFNDAASPRLGVINCWTSATRGIYPLAVHPIASSTAEGGAGAADAAATFYSAVAVNNKPYVVLGYVEWGSGLAAAGAWAAAPTRVKLFGADVPLPGSRINTKVTVHASTVTTTSTAFTSTGITATIAPTSAANPIEVFFAGAGDCDTQNSTSFFDADRGSTSLAGVFGRNALSSAVRAGSGAGTVPQSFRVIDMPATTSSTTYTLKWSVTSGTATLGARNGGGNTATTTFGVEELQA